MVFQIAEVTVNETAFFMWQCEIHPEIILCDVKLSQGVLPSATLHYPLAHLLRKYEQYIELSTDKCSQESLFFLFQELWDFTQKHGKQNIKTSPVFVERKL